MDQALLLDICVAIATALCVGLVLYGAWLCLPELDGTSSSEAAKGSRDETETEAVIRPRPRPRVRAGAGR